VIRSVFFLAVLIGVGCSRPPTAAVTSSAGPTPEPIDLGPARDAIRKPFADADLVRFGLDQLSSLMSRQPSLRPRPLSADDIAFIQKLGANPTEVSNVERPDFGPLDTALVSQALLFRDVARTLEVASSPPLERAKAATEWLARHVLLEERDGPPDPPLQVVLRGRGTALERTYVLLALMHQLGLDAWAVGGADSASDPRKIWAVGVMEGGKIVLFSPPLALPVPGDRSGDIAALTNLPTDAQVVTAVGRGEPRESLAASRLFFGLSWLSLAPRMRAVENLFPAGELRLAVDLERLRAAAAALPISGWSADAYGVAPRVLAEFVPVAEGGVDRAPAGGRRADLFAAGLIRWDDLPRELLELRGPAGNQLRLNFVSVAASDQRPGLAQAIRQRQNLADVVRTMKSQEKEMPEARLQDDIARGVLAAMRGGGDTQGPTLRQLLLRGQYQEAIEAMVALSGQLRSLRSRSDAPAAAAQAKPWAEKVQTAYAEYLRAQRSGELPALNDASTRLEALLKDGRPLELYVQWLAAGQMLARLDFLTALAKHDQAETRHRRDPADAARTWQTAIAAWRSYLANHGETPIANPARRMLGRALAESGQREQAAETFRQAAAKASGPDKAAAELLANRTTVEQK